MRMQSGWTMQVALLVLGLLSLMTPLVYAQDQRYQDLVNELIQEYNTKSGSENLFRLSILNLPSGENNDPAAAPRLLSFTIRETVCPNTENRNPDECDFKENGVVKECLGAIALDSPKPSADISCDGIEKIKRRGSRKRGYSRTSMGRGVRNIWKKVGNAFRKILDRSHFHFNFP